MEEVRVRGVRHEVDPVRGHAQVLDEGAAEGVRDGYDRLRPREPPTRGGVAERPPESGEGAAPERLAFRDRVAVHLEHDRQSEHAGRRGLSEVPESPGVDEVGPPFARRPHEGPQGDGLADHGDPKVERGVQESCLDAFGDGVPAAPTRDDPHGVAPSREV